MLYHEKNPHGGDVYGETVRLDFSANTNPFGTPQGVLDAVAAALSRVHQYPDPYCRELVRSISIHEGVEEDTILCGNGAAELIYAFCEAVRPKCAVELAPTFSEYALAAERVGCQVSRYRLRQERGFSLDEGLLSFLEETKPEVLFLCNPNNPTGCVIPTEQLETILSHCQQNGIRLFLDECFLDLTEDGESLKGSLAAFPNLFLLKAFTKSYGMAGLRLGYGLSGDSRLLEQMATSVQPWNVSLLAQAAGVAALQQTAFLQRTRELVAEQRRWLTQELEALGFWVCPGRANYVLFSAPVGLRERLKEQHIAIRSCENYHGLGAGWYRIAVRLPEENKALIQAMKEVLSWQKT